MSNASNVVAIWGIVFVKNAGTAFGVLEEPMSRWVVPAVDEFSRKSCSGMNKLTRMNMYLHNWQFTAADDDAASFLGNHDSAAGLLLVLFIFIFEPCINRALERRRNGVESQIHETAAERTIP